MAAVKTRIKTDELGQLDRAAFWRYAVYVVDQAKYRANRGGFPFGITAHDLDKLFVDQGWRCAVSGSLFVAPGTKVNQWHRHPFGPSVDRIVPNLGYMPGNIRIVTNMVNAALSNWGEQAFRLMIADYVEWEYLHKKLDYR